tara:strand:- start:510 stop:701 length:192 start_codon:yes stop_codon:yes gene_type:complete
MKKLFTVKNLLIAGAVVGGIMLLKKRKEKGLTTFNPMKIFGKSTASDDAQVVEITSEGLPSDV